MKKFIGLAVIGKTASRNNRSGCSLTERVVITFLRIVFDYFFRVLLMCCWRRFAGRHDVELHEHLHSGSSTRHSVLSGKWYTRILLQAAQHLVVQNAIGRNPLVAVNCGVALPVGKASARFFKNDQ